MTQLIEQPLQESEFEQQLSRHRRELHVHCYRMLGSFDEAEDLVQETFLRAWRKREGFQGEAGFRAWLYRIATNACLDEIRRSRRRASARGGGAEVPWLQPYPDRLLDQLAPEVAGPDAVVVGRETIELAFIAVIQLLPPKQRAVLILRDVLGWPADQSAEALDLTVASANSALQRARATMQRARTAGREPGAGDLTQHEHELLMAFIDMHERGDAAAALALVRDDIRVTMPPHPWLFEGRASMEILLRQAFGPESPGEWRLLPTRANRQVAAASYLRANGETEFRAFKLDVLRIEGGLIAEITTFGSSRFPDLDLPPILDVELRAPSSSS